MLKRLPDGRWRFRLYVAGSKDGPRRQATLSADLTRGEALREMRKHEMQSTPTGQPRVSDLAAEWLAQRGPQVGAGWRNRVKMDLERAILPVLGHRLAAGLTVADLERWRTARRAAGVTAQQQNTEAKVLRTLLNYAVRTGRLERSPIAPRMLPRYQESQGRLVYFSREEWAAFCTAPVLARTGRERRTLELAVRLFRGNLLTATRISEATHLTWADVTDGNVRVFQTKTQRVKFIPITPPLADLLGARRTAGPVFPDPSGAAWKRSTASEAFARLRALSGVRRELVVHSIRHTAASWLAISGAPLRTIQEVTGHASISSTLRYAHLSPEHLKGHLAVLG